ncbi:MAG: hypothetical protein KDI16_11605 [Halioglobus sp.]|nr:hypothetical protein [Halioglobus sp.]
MRWPDGLRGRYTVAADPLRSQRRIELALLLLGLVLCLQLLYSGARLALLSEPDAVMPAADTLTLVPVVAPAMIAARGSEEMRARPVFWESRRPVEATVLATAVVREEVGAGPLRGVKLVGVFGAGDTAGIIALVKDQKRRILRGEQLEGWTLESVQPKLAVLVDGGRREELALVPGEVAAVAAPVDDEVQPRARSQGAPAQWQNVKNTQNTQKENVQGKQGAGEQRGAAGAAPAKSGLSLGG